MGDDERAEEPSGGVRDVLEDLEQQAAGMHLVERDAELLDRARGEYATVSFASRVHASTQHDVRFTLSDGLVVEGRLVEAGVDWCAVTPEAAQSGWLVRLVAVATAYGLSDRALPDAARPVSARLGFGSALRRLGGEWAVARLHVTSGPALRVRVVRVGADFVEAETVSGARSTLLVPFGAIEAVFGG